MRRQLSKSEIKELGNALQIALEKKDHIEEEDGSLLINGEHAFFSHDGRWLPFLGFAQSHSLLKEVVVDMGAVKFVSNGADVMRPGIVSVSDGILAGDAVRVIDLKNHVTLAIGITLFSGPEILTMVGGKAVRTVHHVGDRRWQLSRENNSLMSSKKGKDL